VKGGRKKNFSSFSPFLFRFFLSSKKANTHADAVVDAPPRGQQARTRPPHERPGEGRRGAREFWRRARREEGEDEEEDEEGRCRSCLSFVLLSSSLLSRSLLFRGEIKGRHLFCTEVVEWFELTRKSPDSESFCSRRWSPGATDGEPRSSLETSLRSALREDSCCCRSPSCSLRVFRVESKPLEARRGAKSGNPVAESGTESAKPKRVATRPFFSLNLSTSTPFLLSQNRN